MIAIDETSVLRISGPNVRNMVARGPSLAELTMLRLCDMSRFLCESAFSSQGNSVPQRIRPEIYRVITMQPQMNGDLTVKPAPTHEEIALRAGTNREQVMRVVSEFSKRRLITPSRKS